MSMFCVVGETFTFGMPLEDTANDGKWKSTPTIAAGDFQISINGAAFENLDNIPTVAPSGDVRVQIVVSAAETTAAGDGGTIDIKGIDQAGDEWKDVYGHIRVTEFDMSDVPARVWANIVRTITAMSGDTQVEVGAGTEWVIHRGDDWDVVIDALGDISGRSTLWVSLKENLQDTDDDAIVCIKEGTGLVRLNGEAAATPTDGIILVADEDVGALAIHLEPTATALLRAPATGWYDIQVKYTIGAVVRTMRAYTYKVNPDVTRATS